MAQWTGPANTPTLLNLVAFISFLQLMSVQPRSHFGTPTPSPAPSLTIVQDDQERCQQVTHALHIAHVQMLPHVAEMADTESL